MNNEKHVTKTELKKRAVRLALLLSGCILLLLTAYLVGTGLRYGNSMYLVDYAQLSRGEAVLVRAGNVSSMGYTRACSDISDSEQRMIVRFYSAFGGLNSDWGARSLFTLEPNENCTAIYFERSDGDHHLVLVRDPETGLWSEPPKE